MRRFAGGQQVYARVGCDGPVVVLAAAVDAVKGLFVQQTDQSVPVGDLLHDLHGELVVVGGDVGGRVDRRQLVLRGGNLVVLGFGEDSELPELVVQVGHIGRDARLDDAEVVVVQLLPLRRHGTEERPPAEHEVAALFVHLLVDEEVLLLWTDRGAHALDGGVAEQAQDAHGLLVQRLHRAQQGRLLIERLASIGAEGGGDTERLTLDEGIGCRIPRGIAAGLERRAQAAGGEARGVRLTLNELLAGEFHNHAAVRRGGDEAVVLFGGDAGQRLEPMGEVRRAVLHRPILHRGGHGISDVAVQTRALGDGLAQGIVHAGGQPRLHNAVVKYQASEEFRDCVHNQDSFTQLKNAWRFYARYKKRQSRLR